MIKIKNITKKYGKILALDSLSLAIPKNSVYGLLGPNGAGKTTLLKICCSLIRPDSGDVFIDSKSIRKEPNKVRDLIGLMPEEFGLFTQGQMVKTHLNIKYCF